MNDLQWELEVAHLLLKNEHFALEYEAYGSAHTRSPDYRVTTAAGASFDVEAARIREGRAETRFRTWEQEIRTAIRAIPSRVAVTLEVGVGELGAPSTLVDEIEARLPSLKAGLAERIAQADSELDVGESRRYPIRGAEGLVEAHITRPEQKARHGRTSHDGSSFPVWYTQQEFRKFGDILCAKLGQLRPGMGGILAIGSRNMTHEDIDCERAVAELSRRARRQDEVFFRGKGFGDSAHFLSHRNRLTAIIFRSSWIGSGHLQFRLDQCRGHRCTGNGSHRLPDDDGLSSDQCSI